ncbi:DMT family transporter [Colwellia sp. 4_MG-2023]|uniref:DMT family transporter n=1 Tax=unclassified Colwellia TaxID=196834 RepID=UPI0026E319E2|nr:MULTISPECIES: DMT family transporter [unclassified Colwellia]MDO6486900.1 DMT family transporter [Colwellia sp. 6_MG-2023]MDO6506228.1 DMT family transporter [Colwellia sp. 5_MG-2023]MDO6554712.1 DMT family transporter [Colwellia sp. 4_MG-2023]
MFITLKNSVPMSVWFMLLSALGFSLMAACVKEVSTLGIPVFEIVAARAAVSAVISYVDVKRKNIPLWGNNKPLLIARGTVGTFALMFVYYAVTTLPLAEATLLQYLHPVFTAILALWFLKETIQRSTVACILISLLGLLIIIYPNLAQESLVQESLAQPNLLLNPRIQYSWLSISAGVLGAFGSAVAYILVKKLTVTEDSSVIIFYFPLVAFPVSMLMLGSDFVIPSLTATILLILVGIFTQVGQVGLTKALHCADANKATAYSYVQVLFSVFIGWAYFSEIPMTTTIVGGGLIMVGALINVLWKR